MNISVDKLLAKIEEELNFAKNASKEESLREKIYSIKILCELILDEKGKSVPVQVPHAASVQVPYPAPAFGTQQPVFQQQPVTLNQPKKLEMEDEANGDSLFDF
jgi:hypothetical protein